MRSLPGDWFVLRLTRLAAMVLVGALLAGAAAPERLHSARASFDAGEFRAALVLLEEAERESALTEPELVDLQWLRGASLHALGRQQEARAAFLKLLVLRPLFEPSAVDASPALDATFREAVAAFRATDSVELGLPSLKGATLTVPITRFAERVSTVVASVRTGGASAYVAFTGSVRDGSAEVVLKDAFLWEQVKGSKVLEMVLEARNAAGVPQARLGEAVHPHPLALSTEERAAALAALRTEPAPAAVKATARPSTTTDKWIGWSVTGVLGAAGLLAAGAALLVGAGAGAAYAGLWLYPRDVGMETEAPYRGLLLGYVMGLAATVGLVVVGAGLGTATGVTAAMTALR